MCGISAVFSRSALPLTKRDFYEITALVKHRGPDDEGYVFFSNRSFTVSGGPDSPQSVFVDTSHSYTPTRTIDLADTAKYHAALGHRRLAIIDLSPAGHQPMCSKDHRLWITYNGEIYNYKEIRTDLEKEGHRFQTQTDVEVILQAYERWGEEAFNRFNGMFACVIYDRREERVLAIRDRFGVKPLYYLMMPNQTIAFASEIKQFSRLPEWQPRLNRQMAYDFLNWGLSNHEEDTLFHGVKQLRGGHLLAFSLSQLSAPQTIQPRRWYVSDVKPYIGTLEAAAEQLKALLQDSITLRLRADVALGACLSGGLDSSSIVCLASQLMQRQGCSFQMKTFTASSEVPHLNEWPQAQRLAKHAQSVPHMISPNHGILLKSLDNLIWHQEEPFVSTSIFAQWLVFQSAQQSAVKVILDGQGSDEIFAGYHGFFSHHFYDLLLAGRWRKLAAEFMAMRSLHGSIAPALSLVGHFLPRRLNHRIRRLIGKSSTRPNFVNTQRLQISDKAPLQDSHQYGMNAQSRLLLTHTSLPALLRYEDKNSMAHGVESRLPFLDYRIVEFALSLPSSYKINLGVTKQVLRHAVNGTVPEEIRLRTDKLAFNTAEERWMCQCAPSHFHSLLLEAVDASQGILTPQTEAHFSDVVAGKRSFDPLTWRCISFGLWMKRFGVTV